MDVTQRSEDGEAINVNQKDIDTLIFKLNGAAMAVLNELGHGLREKTKVDEYIPDLEIENTLLLDAKVVPKIGDNELGQMLNFLKITKQSVGLIQNFKHPKLDWRVVYPQID